MRGVLSSAVLVGAHAFQASFRTIPREYSAPRAGVGQLNAWLHVMKLRIGVFRVACMNSNLQRGARRRRAGCFAAAFGASAPPCQRWTNESHVSVAWPYTWISDITDPAYPCDMRSSFIYHFACFLNYPSSDGVTKSDLTKLLIFVLNSLDCTVWANSHKKRIWITSDCLKEILREEADRPPKTWGEISYLSLFDHQTTYFPENGQKLPHQRHISIQPISMNFSPPFQQISQSHTSSHRASATYLTEKQLLGRFFDREPAFSARKPTKKHKAVCHILDFKQVFIFSAYFKNNLVY